MRKIITNILTVINTNHKFSHSSEASKQQFQKSSSRPDLPLGFKSRASSDFFQYSSR